MFYRILDDRYGIIVDNNGNLEHSSEYWKTVPDFFVAWMDFKETVLELKSPVMELQKDRIVSAGMDTHIQFSGGGRGSGQSPEKDFRFQYRNAVPFLRTIDVR